MQKIIRVVENGVVQVTVGDERWYWKGTIDLDRQIAEGKWVPSVTWITSYYPKGKGFEIFLKNAGDEAEDIKRIAGEKGSKIHQAIADAIRAGKNGIGMDYRCPNPTTGFLEELTPEEYWALQTFAAWAIETKPQIIANEVNVFSDKFEYSGTLDILCVVNRQPWLIDVKTPQQFYVKDELQISAYLQAIRENPKQIEGLLESGIDSEKIKLAIFQPGYIRNQNHWKFTEVEYQFDRFLAIKEHIWTKECANVQPKKYEWPVKIVADTRKYQPDGQGETSNLPKPTQEVPAVSVDEPKVEDEPEIKKIKKSV